MLIYEYPPIEPIIDRNKTWVNIKYKRLYSREIKHFKYAYISRTFDKNSRQVEYFIVTGNNIFDDIQRKTYLPIDDYNRTYLSLRSIWDEVGFDDNKADFPINIQVVKEDTEGVVYKICI